MQPFAERVHLNGNGLSRRGIDALQVNLGRYCNQACIHCHVESGPTRTEMMNRETVEAVVKLIERSSIPTVDITGGAPELNPHFVYLVESAITLGRHVIDRCNLTVIFEPGMEHLAQFFQRHRVELICSLPCYTEENVDRQRGKGTFDLSVRALKIFNDLGYGRDGSDLVLNLVYNPVGPHLPPPQGKLEQDYKKALWETFGIEFNHLYCITNMPITRYAAHLKLRGEYGTYLELLETNFNAAALDHVMCRNLISIGWDGTVYDCDFNQMLGIPLRDAGGQKLHLSTLSIDQAQHLPVSVGNHCYACAAGSGSSCGGALIS